MNKLLIVTGLIFFLSAFIGYKRGFLKIAASLAATILTLVFVTMVSPYIGKAILKYTPLEETVQKKCLEMLTSEGQEMETATVGLTREEQITAIENAKLPVMFQKRLLENNNSEVYEFLGVSSFVEYVGSYLAKTIANLLAFLLASLLAIILVRVFLLAFNIIGKLPVIGGVNRLAGGVVGLGTGLVIVWVVMMVVSLLYSTSLGQAALLDVENSKFLTFLYENNILMNRIIKF